MLKQVGILWICVMAILPLHAEAQKKLKNMPVLQQEQNNKKMRVDIWSDVMCPFCYIGKRHFEAALEEVVFGKNVEVVWHSFQLDPDTKPQPDKDAITYLAERKGQSIEWSKQAHAHVTQMAANAGLIYNFDKAVIANSFDAHRLLQQAKKYGKGDELEELLFKGYFTEGKDIANHTVLAGIAKDIGLDEQEVQNVLNSDMYSKEVQEDIATAAKIGVNGVPFFVVNNKYGISGAQPTETFTKTLSKAWEEYEKENPNLTMVDGDAAACEPGGDCK